MLALVFAALLSAPGMHKAAFNRQPGLGRDVALALTGPLAAVSHALLLDRPRQLVLRAIGREAADRIDTSIALPPAVATAPPRSAGTSPTTTKTGPGRDGATVAAPARRASKPAFTPKHKLRLWVAGDSLVITPGWSVVRAAGASPVIQPVGGVDGKVATGLGRPDVFNWFREIDGRMRVLRPDAVIVSFGANDDHNYMTGVPSGTALGAFGSPSWTREYRRRVGVLMDTVVRRGAFLVWIGLPITRSPNQTRDFDTINAIVEREARKRRGRVAYVDTYRMFASDTGGFAEFLPDASGRMVEMRARDGVHFERAGGEMIAREVLRRLNEAYNLTGWRKRRTP